jgi:hypothetical protein
MRVGLQPLEGFSDFYKENELWWKFSSPLLISHFTTETTVVFWNGVGLIQIKLGLGFHSSHFEYWEYLTNISGWMDGPMAGWYVIWRHCIKPKLLFSVECYWRMITFGEVENTVEEKTHCLLAGSVPRPTVLCYRKITWDYFVLF